MSVMVDLKEKVEWRNNATLKRDKGHALQVKGWIKVIVKFSNKIVLRNVCLAGNIILRGTKYCVQKRLCSNTLKGRN